MGIIALFGLFIIVMAIALYIVAIYNGLVRVSHNIDKAWANIDVLLKQRHDEIPKLIATCEGYMQYERQTLEKLTAARTSCMSARTVGESSVAEEGLTSILRSLFAVAENYPDLKTNQQFLQMQQRISGLENQIADRRELYNDSVNTYNVRINVIPDSIIATMRRMKPRDLFKVADKDKKDVEIKFNLPK